MEKSEYYNYLREINSVFSRKTCFASSISNCSHEMTNAHTIQKRRSLDSISNNGHVCGFITSKTNNSKEHLVFSDKISLNKASTFYGFCKKHDTELFVDLDTGVFIPTLKQIFLITFRTITWQLYIKIGVFRSKQKLSVFHQKNKTTLSSLDEKIFRTAYFGSKCLYAITESMCKNIRQDEFASIQYLLIRITSLPEIMVSGTFIPDTFMSSLSADGNISYSDINIISLNIFSDSKSGFILFTWLSDYNQNNETYLACLILSNAPLMKIIELCFYKLNENMFFSKKWWDKLTLVQTKTIVSMVNYIMLANETIPKLDNVIDWKIQSWESNNIRLRKNLTTASTG